MHEPLLRVLGLRVGFRIGNGWFGRARWLPAVSDVSLTLRKGEALGVVGESGCGKSTLVRAILRLVPANSGEIVWLGKPLAQLTVREMRPLREHMQIVFQDPLASLDPRMTVGEIIAEPLRVHRREMRSEERRAEVARMLERVGLAAEHINRYPHEFSGGQCQRIGIARAMVLRPRLLVCDEPVSALDVSIQAQIVNLLLDLKREFGTSIIFVSHNLAVVRRVCERVLVLYLGKTMELAPARDLFAIPRHPYTRALIAAIPVPDPGRYGERSRFAMKGELPSPLDPPTGCVFRTRCPYAVARCAAEVPPLESISDVTSVACHRWREFPLEHLQAPPSP
jgi:oligopeptide transport system ATP-binding protein